MKPGIAPVVLAEQVRATAPWLSEIEGAEGAVRYLADLEAAEASRTSGPPRAYVAMLLSAHWATVATFVPTDVDARIRHHVWQGTTDQETLDRLVALVDEVTAWPSTLVSARTVDTGLGPMSGHDGEWFSVRAGALARAHELGAADTAAKIDAQIEAELAREEETVRRALRGDDAVTALSACTIVAHNLGDLSRVVDLWPRAPGLAEPRERFRRLGHEDAARDVPVLRAAGELNKRLMARENHRFLALRKPRGLRRARALLLPIGPWFEAWGERVATHPALEPRDVGEVVGALMHQHQRAPGEAGCLRALAGIHQATAGGLPAVAEHVPARLRKELGRGAVRDAIDVPRERFAEQIARRFEGARASVAALIA